MRTRYIATGCSLLMTLTAPAFADCQGGQPFDQTLMAVDGNTLGWAVPADVDYVLGALQSVESYAAWERGSLTAATECAVSELTAETSAPRSGVPKPIGRHLHRWAMMSHACGQRIVLAGISSRIRRR